MAAKKGGNKARNGKATAALAGAKELQTMTFWRNLARLTNPEVKDDFEIGEIAIALQQICKGFTTEWESVSKICNKNEDTKVGIAIAITVDRRTQPSDVTVKFGYAEKHSVTYKSQVPDPNQDELPGMKEPDAEQPEAPTEE